MDQTNTRPGWITADHAAWIDRALEYDPPAPSCWPLEAVDEMLAGISRGNVTPKIDTRSGECTN